MAAKKESLLIKMMEERATVSLSATVYIWALAADIKSKASLIESLLFSPMWSEMIFSDALVAQRA